MSGAITQSAVPPYTMHCHACGKQWEPRPARGKDHPTDASLDREATAHWRTCPARLP